MALAEAAAEDKAEKKERPSTAPSESGGPPNWINWAPRKLGELRLFFSEVKSELKKVTWPGRNEVQSTTIVVVFTTVLFGFYLYGMDLGFSWLLSFILKQ
jgi:preprotein translocase subunit SecE